jgi:hypothetical protein
MLMIRFVGSQRGLEGMHRKHERHHLLFRERLNDVPQFAQESADRNRLKLKRETKQNTGRASRWLWVSPV